MQLLLGVKDTNDVLVAKTLLCLADLVPILGSAVVIGGNRSKIFADGRPQGVPDQTLPWSGVRSITPVIGSGEFLSGSPLPPGTGEAVENSAASFASIVGGAIGTTGFDFMPQRLSPEGGHTNSDIELEVDEWSDWENDVNEHTASHAINQLQESPERSEEDSTATTVAAASANVPSKPDRQRSVPPAESIENLDIKTQPVRKAESSGGDEEIDFFKDMEPVIQRANVLLINEDEEEPAEQREESGEETIPLTAVKSPDKTKVTTGEQESPLIKVDRSRFDVKVDDQVDEDGWDNEESEW